MADGNPINKKPLNRDPYRLGNSFVFPPRVMDDIHIKAELGRYRMRGFSLFKNCLLYTSPSPRDGLLSRMPSSA